MRITFETTDEYHNTKTVHKQKVTLDMVEESIITEE